MTLDLYDTDFLAWTEEQAKALRRAKDQRLNAPIDWDAVAEEIEDLGKSRLTAVQSFLRLIILHCLKLELTATSEPRRHWQKEVDNFRAEIEDRIEESPSLAGRLNAERAYRRAAKTARYDLPDFGVDPASIPADCPYSLEQLLDADWWPTNRHGLSDHDP